MPVLALAALLSGCGSGDPEVVPAAASPAAPADTAQPGHATCRLYRSTFTPTFEVTADATHAGPGFRDIRVVVGFYQQNIRVQEGAVDLADVPSGTVARETASTGGLGGADPAQPWECRVEGALFLDSS